MKEQGKIIGNIMSHGFHGCGMLLLFVFTATCTILLFRQYSPPSAPWLPYAALAVFEGGLLQWSFFSRRLAKNAIQLIIALVMTIISALMISASTAFQIISWFSSSGLVSMPEWIESLVFYSVALTFTLDVLAYIAVSMCGPETLKLFVAHNNASLLEDARKHTIVTIAYAKDATGVTLPPTTVTPDPQKVIAVPDEPVKDVLANFQLPTPFKKVKKVKGVGKEEELNTQENGLNGKEQD